MLAGGAAALFGEILGPLYLRGRIWVTTSAYGGDGSLTRTQTVTDCRVQVDAATERMVQAEGYTSSDRAIYVLRGSRGGVPLDSDCEIEVDEGPYTGSRWKVATPIESDPGGAYWLCRGVLLP